MYSLHIRTVPRLNLRRTLETLAASKTRETGGDSLQMDDFRTCSTCWMRPLNDQVQIRELLFSLCRDRDRIRFPPSSRDVFPPTLGSFFSPLSRLGATRGERQLPVGWTERVPRRFGGLKACLSSIPRLEIKRPPPTSWERDVSQFSSEKRTRALRRRGHDFWAAHTSHIHA